MKADKYFQKRSSRNIYTITAGSLLILLYIVIFCFSAENGAESSRVSTAVTRALLKSYYGLTGKNRVALTDMVYALEGIIRKLAHFLEYFCVGLLSFSLAVAWKKPLRKGAALVTGQLLISAALDELHQYFVPGRYASPKDVLIDTAGGIAGIGFLMLIRCCILRHREKISGSYNRGRKEQRQLP